MRRPFGKSARAGGSVTIENDETFGYRNNGSRRELRIARGRHSGRSRRRLLRGRETQHALGLGGQLHARRPFENRRHGPQSRREKLPDGQHRRLRGRDRRGARRDRPGQGRRRRCRDRLGPGGDPLRPADRAGGAHLHPVQRLELRGGAVLRPMGRHGGPGARTDAGAGGRNTPEDRRGGDPRSAGRAGSDRDVRPRRPVHVRFGQVLPLALRNELLGQPRRVPPAVPPQIHRHGQGDRRAARHRRTLRPLAQGSLHGRFPRQDDRGGGPGPENRGTRPRCGVRQARGRVLRRGAPGPRSRKLHPGAGRRAEREAPDGLQPWVL